MYSLPNFCRVCLKYEKNLIDLAHIENEPSETLMSKLEQCVSEVVCFIFWVEFYNHNFAFILGLDYLQTAPVSSLYKKTQHCFYVQKAMYAISYCPQKLC